MWVIGGVRMVEMEMELGYVDLVILLSEAVFCLQYNLTIIRQKLIIRVDLEIHPILPPIRKLDLDTLRVILIESQGVLLQLRQTLLRNNHPWGQLSIEMGQLGQNEVDVKSVPDGAFWLVIVARISRFIIVVFFGKLDDLSLCHHHFIITCTFSTTQKLGRILLI